MIPQTIILDGAEKVQYAVQVLLGLPLNFSWQLTFKRYVPRRTTSQNRRLWKLYQIAAEQTGIDPEDMHEFALCRYFGYDEKKVGGMIRCVPLERSSTQDIEKFGLFMTATEAWLLQEFGVFLDEGG